LLEGLEKAGFKLDQGPDDARLFMKHFQRGGGYYIDVGASQLIIDVRSTSNRVKRLKRSCLTTYGLKTDQS
jgi:hypothetical protein